MQKLDLGAEYNSETSAAAPATTELDQHPPLTQASATYHSSTPTRMETSTMPRANSSLPLLIAGVAIVAGVLTGFGAYRLQAKGGSLTGGAAPIAQVADEKNIKNGDVFGSTNAAAFKDSAEGYLEIGGVEGEGSHKLLRAGGASQTVYLVSTVTDLDKFEGMTIKVWGETYKGQKVGWLMDVGRVQIVNTQGQSPATE